MKQYNKIRTSVTLDPDVYESIKIIAEKEDRSISQQINKMLKDQLRELNDRTNP